MIKIMELITEAMAAAQGIEAKYPKAKYIAAAVLCLMLAKCVL